uniref:DOG1 domain-containing protein n=1 Tax=Oryza barthii TaxID=65489 RepID=A0A0D3GY79_9ORYZ
MAAAAAAAADSTSAVPPAVVSAAEDTLAAAESVGDHLAEMVAAAGEDPDAIAELPPLRRARAFLAMAKAAASLFAGRQLSR